MKHFHFLVLLLCVGIAAQAQTVSGKLLDLADNTPLKTANLTLSQTKDTTVKFNALSNAEGAFSFTGIPTGTYTLQVSSVGYDIYKQAVALTDSIPSLQLGTLFIPKATKELEGVTVVGKQAPVQQKGDTVIYNASQYKVNPDATVEDLIKKMPNVVVGRDGTVTAAGETVRKVTIDGKDFFGDDASAALKNLPSSVVDKIQVFDRLSDQAQLSGFDDGNSVKSLNIITKSGISNGQFGRIYGGYGTDERYAAGGNISFFNGNRRLSFVGNFNNVNQQNFGAQDLLGVTSTGGGGGGRGGGGNRGGGGGGNWGGGGGQNFQVGQQAGISTTNAIGINYGDKWGKKIDVSGSYFFNQSNNSNDSRNRTTTITDRLNRLEYDSSVSRTNNYNHRFNMRLEYKIDSFNTIMVIPSLNFQTNNSDTYSYGYTLDNNTVVNNQVGTNSTDRDGYNLRNTIMFRHTFKNNRRRSYSVSFNQTFNKNNATSYIDMLNQSLKGGGLYDSLQNQYVNNPTSGYTLGGNISYNEPIGQKGMLQISYQPTYSKNDADRRTYDFDPITGEYSTFQPIASNTFENTTTTHNGGVTYRLGMSRDNQFSVGANFQYSTLGSERIYPTTSSFKQSFTNVLPNLMWSKKLNPKSSFRLFYRASTNFPSVTQLQDVVNNSNALRLSVGNPELKQSYNHFLSTRYTFTNTQKGQSFFANVFLNAQQNYITNALFIAVNGDSTINGVKLDSSSGQLTKPMNMNGYKNLSTFFTFSQPINAIKSNISLSTGFTYSTIPGMYNYIKNMTDNYGINAGIVLASNINEYIDFNLSYNVTFNNAQSSDKGQTITNRSTNQTGGAQVNLLSKNGWFLQNDVVNQTNSGLSEGFNTSYWLWNAAIGKKFLKNKTAELKLSVFDLLKQNQSISRTVGANNQIIDSWNQVLQQYFMLTFTYTLKNFGKGRATSQPQRQWGGPGGPGGMGGPPMF
jgi:hypothetical protein